MTDTTEPAVPVTAPVPLKSLMDLLEKAERDWPQASAPGVGVAFVVDKVGVSVAVTLNLHDDIDGAILASRQFDGDWQVSGGLRWTMRQ